MTAMKPVKKREGVWEFKEEGMNVPARIYASDTLFPTIEDGVYRQIGNVAKLPGIVDAVMVMPDGHYGYGFPIGGVAAFDLDAGVISPGGVGYDINCGVRLLSSNLKVEQVKPKLKNLTDILFDNVPSGLGSKSRLSLMKSVLMGQNGLLNKDLELKQTWIILKSSAGLMVLIHQRLVVGRVEEGDRSLEPLVQEIISLRSRQWKKSLMKRLRKNSGSMRMDRSW